MKSKKRFQFFRDGKNERSVVERASIFSGWKNERSVVERASIFSIEK